MRGMDAIEIDTVATPALEDPVLLEGLPGVGLVGKVAVDHLVEELESQPVRRIHSEYFPPAVSVDESGTATLASLTLHAVETDGRDLLVLAGDSQAQESTGQYRLAAAVLDVAAEFDAGTVIAIGGYGTGEQVEDHRVLGAVPEGDDALREQLEAAGVRFEREDAPGSIVGMSGLLVGLASRRGVESSGLLGLTSGYHVDPASARAVLEVLQAAFGFTVSLETLDEQAERIQALLDRLQTGQAQDQPGGQGGEDLRYFG